MAIKGLNIALFEARWTGYIFIEITGYHSFETTTSEQQARDCVLEQHGQTMYIRHWYHRARDGAVTSRRPRTSVTYMAGTIPHMYGLHPLTIS